jgi:hypothetical protein
MEPDVVGDWINHANGIYIYRAGDYGEGPDGDNWSYIAKDLSIRDFRPVEQGGTDEVDGKLIAGPFPTLEAAKAAYILIYGRSVSHA